MAAEAGTGIRPLGDADPRSVGPYRLIGRLGSGGMGSVYAGLDHADRRVAIKIVHAQFADDREFRARFTREVALLRRVQGTCTTPVLDADVDAAQPWFACEYVPGPTLAERVDHQGPMAGDELYALATGLAEALVALHDVGIVHRDLKPQNVVCSPAGPRVLDLGIARSMEDSGLTRTGMMIGSPAWMSPERFRGQNSTPAADVYAWAMMVAYAATGTIPFGTGAPEVVALRVLQEHADTSGVPQPLRPLVDWGADKDPLRRPTAHALLSGVTTSWRNVLGAGSAPAHDPVSDATSLIDMHWKAPSADGAWGHASANQADVLYGGGNGAPPAPPSTGGYTGYTAGHSGAHSAGYPAANGSGYTPAAPPPPVHGQPTYTAHQPPQQQYGAPQHGDTFVGHTLDGLAQAPPAKGRRRGAADDSDNGRRRVVLAAVAGVVAVAAIAGVIAAMSGDGGGKKDKKVQPAAQTFAPPPPGTVTGPNVFELAGLKLPVPADWDARPIDATSVCIAPLNPPATQPADCLRNGLRVWVGATPQRQVALDDPAGWTLGAPAVCPGAAPGSPAPESRTSGRTFVKLGDLKYEYAQYQVTCGGTQLQPQVWWLPQSKISFSTGALPKSYDATVNTIIATIDKKGYKQPK
ncbi:serine/threonine-protein kinase [Yinghuangia seranimata]|uniref:serine/threonine-protein kinase n=1 Tax=Yinghuangia seranimata TaxID=408067 RepID=UPI00248C1C82|nr:serine/threonine-protein kinase [Yinghuangia seranimata]MDI2132668.1 serine/threonine-protein kinase [Yinghuangia seranimata]